MSNLAITPRDIMPNDVDHVQCGDTTIRKGTMAAFIANLEVIESPTASAIEKADALAVIKVLAPKLKAFQIHKHAQWRNPQIEALFTKD